MPKPPVYVFEPSLPSDIVNSPVPTDNRSVSTLNFDYRLDDNGYIHIRTRTPDDPKAFVRGDVVSVKGIAGAGEWQLLDGIGVPYDEHHRRLRSLLAPNEKIVALAVANEIVVAVSEVDDQGPDSDRQVYLFKPTEKTRPLCWSRQLGSPDFVSGDILMLPRNYRGMTFCCSVCRKDDVRKTDFMNQKEIVTYASDANKVNFDFGFTPTIYILDEDGQYIVYWDTGLPASFSRGFLVPEGTQGVFLRAAGSTIFLSARDETGKLHFFTRGIFDYEWNAGCPGIDVSFNDDVPIQYPPEGPQGSFFLGHGVRKMPLEGFIEHPVDDLEPFLTPYLSIAVTGKGDAERDLKIAGRAPESGEWGYYYKKINEPTWQFCVEPTAEPLDLPKNQLFPFNPRLPKTLRLNYDGKLSYVPKRVFSCKIPSIIPPSSEVTITFEGLSRWITASEPCYLTLKYGEEMQRLRIYLVDAWGLSYNHRNDDKLIGREGEPKPLVGTLILTPEQLELTENPRSALGSYVKKYFLDFHEKTKAIPVLATDQLAIMKFGYIQCTLKRTLSPQEKACSFYRRKAEDPRLSMIPQNKEECANLLQANKDRLSEIKTIHHHRLLHASKNALINGDLSFIRPVVSLLFKEVIQPKDPTYEQAIKDIKLLFRLHRAANMFTLRREEAPEGYYRAKDILHSRIKHLERQVNNYHEHRGQSAPAIM